MPSDLDLSQLSGAAPAASVAGQKQPDRIFVRDHVVRVDIGAFQAERGAPQRISFTVVVDVAAQGAPLGDDVDRILSYDRITDAIADALADERLNLLETLAERVAERVLAHGAAQQVLVRIEKLDRGPGALGVEICRSRTAARLPAQGPAPVPMLIYLGAEAAAAPDFPRWLDRWLGAQVPVILCVGLPAMRRPQACDPRAQRRIDLLAIEQNAWQLAARDPRCKVVGTRTELDWAMRAGQISVWAPSKIVLDAVEAPPGPAVDALALAAWLARSFGASELCVIGAQTTAETAVPLRHVELAGALP